MTTLGAAMVFLFRGEIESDVQKVFLGFAAGVMIAASVWSLLIPAIDEANKRGQVGWMPAAGGFILGIGFLLLLDTFLPHLHPGSKEAEGVNASLRRTTLLVFASQHNNNPAMYAGAVALAMGIGIQNFPEAQLGEHSHKGTLGVMAGFLIMMILDVALG